MFLVALSSVTAVSRAPLGVVPRRPRPAPAVRAGDARDLDARPRARRRARRRLHRRPHGVRSTRLHARHEGLHAARPRGRQAARSALALRRGGAHERRSRARRAGQPHGVRGAEALPAMADKAFSFEFFPPKTPEGKAKLRATLAASSRSSSRAFFSLHLRRRRLDARGHARDGARHPRRRPRGRAAHLLHRLHAQRDARASSSSATRARHPARRRAARRPAFGPRRRRANSATRASWCASSASETGDWFHIEVGVLSGVPPADAQRRDEDLPTSSARSTPARTRAITQYFYNADAYFRFVDDAQAAGIARADRARHHADRQLLAARALLGRVRRRDPALDALEARVASATTRRRIRAFGLDVVDRRSASGCSPAARPACTSTRSTRQAFRPRFGNASGSSPHRGRHPRARRGRALRRACAAAAREPRCSIAFVRGQAAQLAPDPDIVLVDIDEKSLAGDGGCAGRWPWPRVVHAELIEGLAAQKPRAIVFDIMFAEPDRFRPQDDAAFAETVAQHRQHVLSRCCACRRSDDAKGVRLAELAPLLGLVRRQGADAGARAWPSFRRSSCRRSSGAPGSINFLEDADGVGRRYLLREVDRAAGTCRRCRRAWPSISAFRCPTQDDLVLAWRGRRGRDSARLLSATCTRTSTARRARGRPTNSPARSSSSARPRPACRTCA